MQTRLLKMFALGTVVLGVLSATAVQSAWAEESKEKAAIGKPAPDFTLTGIDGKEYKLSDYKDKIVVLEWFNRKCPVSRGAAKLMSETSSKYAKQGVVWFAIDSTNPKNSDYAKPAEIAQYAKANHLDYPILKDEDGNVGRAYGAKTTPHMFIINKGELVYVGGHTSGGRRGGESSRNYIAESLDALLAGKAVPNPETKNHGCGIKY